MAAKQRRAALRPVIEGLERRELLAFRPIGLGDVLVSGVVARPPAEVSSFVEQDDYSSPFN